MKIIDRFKNIFENSKQAPPQPTTMNAFINETSPPPKYLEDHLESYKEISWIYKAVKKNAEKTAEIDLRLMRHVSSGTSGTRAKAMEEADTEEIVDHPVLELLADVNDFMTMNDLLVMTQSYLELVGEAYWAIIDGNDGMPKELWILRPDKVEIQRDEEEFISGYLYKPNVGTEVRFEPENVVPFKEFDPLNPYRGMGAVMAVAYAGDTDLFAQKWNRNFFFNSAMPLMAIIFESQTGEKSIKKFMRQWNNKYQGVDNAHKVAGLSGVKDIVTDIQQTHKDMDFLEMREFNRDEIISIFGVPKTVIGITDDVNRANAEATTSAWLEHEIRPKMKRLANTLTEFLLRRYDNSEEMFFDFVDPVPENREETIEELKAQNIPWMTPNDMRRQAGLEPFDDENADSLYLPINVSARISDDGEVQATQQESFIKIGPETKNTPTFKSGLRKTPLKKSAVRAKERVMKVLDHHWDDLVDVIGTEMSKDKEETKDRDIDKVTREQVWKQFISMTDSFEERYMDILRGLFEEQEQQVITNLEQQRSIKDMKKKQLEEEVLFDLTEWTEKFEDELGPIVAEVVKVSGQQAVEELEGDIFDTSDETVREFIENDSLTFVKDMNETTQEQLRGSLAEGVDNGESIDDLSSRVRETFTRAKTTRSETIARTEVLRASNFSRVEGFKQQGVEQKEWLSSLDDRVRDTHASANGQTVNVGDKFEVGGAELSQPGDPRGPARETINCRCTTIPVVD